MTVRMVSIRCFRGEEAKYLARFAICPLGRYIKETLLAEISIAWNKYLILVYS